MRRHLRPRRPSLSRFLYSSARAGILGSRRNEGLPSPNVQRRQLGHRSAGTEGCGHPLGHEKRRQPERKTKRGKSKMLSRKEEEEKLQMNRRVEDYL
ncbi:hypothetical protein LIER_39332 [Lithospermum erythrorhizon]|uniref:Uncharacterized protein n=1 Tax=Lithospermum erythrorhizon TaxID=34254 RepID=A0AAV3QFX8_LITER